MIFELLKDIKVETKALKQREEGDFLIVMSKDLKISYLNSMAKDVYSRLNETNTIADIYDELLNEYDVAEDVLKADLISLMRDLQWQSLIRLKRA
ncbi:hypothetical protein FACS1894167_15510 [Synergistales bacterium]|nr:hypothetical protein FACS1894167_15510 [Synergistales bacterium]